MPALGADVDIDVAVAGVPGLSNELAGDLRALLSCVHATVPEVSTVLGGSLAEGTAGAAPDIDLFVIVPSRRAALAVLRSRALRARLDALELTADAELVVLWEGIVRAGRTALCGRLLTGDPSLAVALEQAPAPPVPNIIATAHHFLVQSLLEPGRADRLIAKAAVTGFRAWLRSRTPNMPAHELFSLTRTRAAFAALGDGGGPISEARTLVDEALGHLEGAPAAASSTLGARRAAVVAFLARLPIGRARLPRRWLRHAATRRRTGTWPVQLIDPTRAFAEAARAVVTAADASAPADTLDRAAAAVRRLTGRSPGGRAGERVRLLARALDAYGRDYPHKLLVSAPPASSGLGREPVGVSVVVPCLNSADTLPRLLESIEHQQLPSGCTLETIVVDNGSTDDSAAVAAQHGATVLREATPGASAARNTGSARARGSVVIFVDADAILQGRDFVQDVLHAFAASKGVGLVGAAIECDPEAGALGRADHMVCFFNWQATQPAEERHFHPSAALAASRAALEATGGFDEALRSFHDFDFCRRARAAGFVLFFEPRARVAHVPRATFATIVRHSFRWGWNSRRVYAAHDPVHTWRFLDRPLLFMANVPFHVANRIWLTVKRWFWRRPLDTVLLAPVLVVLLCAWGAGVAVGGRSWIRTEAARASAV